MARFKLSSLIRGYKKLFGMSVEVYNKDGELLDSIDLDNSKKRFNLKFNKEDAFNGDKTSELTIKLIDTNGDEHNFEKRNGDIYDMENDEQTFTKTIKSRKRRQRMKLQPQSEQIEQASEVELTAQLDEVDSEQLSNLNDVIKSDVGTLGAGQQDLIADGSSDDSDLLDARTNNAFGIAGALDATAINQIRNIETIKVSADNDNGGSVDLNKIVNLQKLEISGTFNQELEFTNWANPGATEFDFSGISSELGVKMLAANAGNTNFAEALTFKGSSGGDTFQALKGQVTCDAGAGLDFINLGDHDAQHLIQLTGQTTADSKDTVENNSFQGALNANAQANSTFDLVEIDAATFTNYTANDAVTTLDFAAVNNNDLTGVVVTAADENDLLAQNFDNNGDGILGFAANTGILYFSATGDFSNGNAAALLDIGGVEGVNFVAEQQIQVV